jgi:hypothetical protein
MRYVYNALSYSVKSAIVMKSGNVYFILSLCCFFYKKYVKLHKLSMTFIIVKDLSGGGSHQALCISLNSCKFGHLYLQKLIVCK